LPTAMLAPLCCLKAMDCERAARSYCTLKLIA
jgi:hypothetical protein